MIASRFFCTLGAPPGLHSSMVSRAGAAKNYGAREIHVTSAAAGQRAGRWIINRSRFSDGIKLPLITAGRIPGLPVQRF